MRVSFGEISHDDSSALNSVTLEERWRSIELAEGIVVRYTIVSDQRRRAITRGISICPKSENRMCASNEDGEGRRLTDKTRI